MLRQRWIAAAIGLVALLAGRAPADLVAPTVTGGGGVLPNGSVVTIGEFATAAISGPLDDAEQGAVPCWFADCAGDVNGDAEVDLDDLAILLTNFGTPGGAERVDGDLDGDGDVDISDLAVLLTLFGTVCA